MFQETFTTFTSFFLRRQLVEPNLKGVDVVYAKVRGTVAATWSKRSISKKLHARLIKAKIGILLTEVQIT